MADRRYRSADQIGKEPVAGQSFGGSDHTELVSMATTAAGKGRHVWSLRENPAVVRLTGHGSALLDRTQERKDARAASAGKRGIRL